MIIADGIDANIEICDIETMADFVDIGCYNPDTKTWTEFEISSRKNDLYKFVHWYTHKPCDYMVTFNGIGFDHQVLQSVIYKYDQWYDLDGPQIAAEIYKITQQLIDNGRYNIRPPYFEQAFPVKPIDLYRIHHFDNEARRTSLKWCAFMMNMDVEEMPIHHSRTNLSPEEMDTVIAYRRNDCWVTGGLLCLTLGDLEGVSQYNNGAPIDHLKDYKDVNKIQLRMDIEDETGLQCLNWSDVKIGEELNKAEYIEAENVTDEWSLVPKKVRHPYGKKFKQFFPHTMSFQTQQLKDFTESFGNQYVLSEKQEFPITIGRTTYTIAKGGIHSTESNRVLIPSLGQLLRDADVGSQYPRAILKYKVYPPHLKSTILDNFEKTVIKKAEYKELGKKAKDNPKQARIFKSLEGSTKLRMNGGYFGKLGQPGSFLEYPEGLMKITIGNQIEILMLIEDLEMNGITVVSGNTDGIVSLFREDQEELYNKICAKWEEKVENTVLGKLEYADFAGLWQEGINSYIGKKTDGKVKKKGRFVTEYGSPGCEINKNKSNRIIPLALEAYFIDGKDPIEFIKNHDSIFDFLIAKKAVGQLHYDEILGIKNGVEQVKVHKKLIRYFVSTDGHVFKKRGIGNTGKEMDSYCEAPDKTYTWLGEPKLTYFNKVYKKDMKDYHINYDWYIIETLERIDKIEKTKKAKQYAEKLKPTQQTALFDF